MRMKKRSKILDMVNIDIDEISQLQPISENMIGYLEYESRIEMDFSLNKPKTKLFVEYFNLIKNNKSKLKQSIFDDISIIFDGTLYADTIFFKLGMNYTVILKYDNINLCLNLKSFIDHNEARYYISLSSKEKTNLKGNYIYDLMFKDALKLSTLKGSILKIDESESWNQILFDEKTFDDVYLPQNKLNDSKLFVEVFEKEGKMLRYLLVGYPGTGKTELVIALSNILNKMGVTILKTTTIENIDFVFELAEMLEPSLVISDDIDLLIGDRNKGFNPENLRKMLDSLDGTNKISDKVGFIATTNSPNLLDIAARRPGRFNKIIPFGELTYENIQNIIIKSFKNNFKNEDIEEIKNLFLNEKLVNWFLNNKVTGSYIYNTIKMSYLQIKQKLLEKDIDKIIKIFEEDQELLKQIKTTDYLTEEVGDSKRKLGF